MRSKASIQDQVALASSGARLRVPAFKIINSLQNSGARPGEQILATAVALIAMCESTGVNLSTVIAKAVRITSAVEGPFTSHLQAVRDYAGNELRKGVV